ncbi:VOC family protein [Rhizobium bangladeshense]|uniref:VOC family protein n=1 Tax=Rhizobium bangladeshense TaxID=1138189 RepID=UPI0007E579E7|nr:VOC family protein [Rhizobium bangladeshense]
MRLTPFLMFQGGKAEQAMQFYASIFPKAQITALERYGPGATGPEGTVMRAQIEIAGQAVMCVDSPINHAFDFTPSFSFFVDCDDEDELDRLSSALSENGVTLMPLGDYGFSRKFAWVNDQFGVSWQLNLP